MKKIALIIFLLAAFAELISRIVDIEWLHTIAKPLIMIALGVYYYFSVSVETRSNMVLLAIILCLAGDVLLMFPNQFITGLIAFLLGHISYIVAYRQHRGEEKENALSGVHRIRLAFPIILAGTGLVIILYPALGDLRIPVIIYALVLSLMVLNALFRFGRTNSESFWSVFFGAVLFMASDSILAIDKFLSPITLGGFFIMLTYIAGQYLIVTGLIRHSNRNVK
jgi:uncharacterized membrane protein YhhN